jgi:hypothetical protein
MQDLQRLLPERTGPVAIRRTDGRTERTFFGSYPPDDTALEKSMCVVAARAAAVFAYIYIFFSLKRSKNLSALSAYLQTFANRNA